MQFRLYLTLTLLAIFLADVRRCESAPGDEKVSTSDTDLTAVVGSNNKFAFDLFAELRPARGNLFFSPTSISTALAMTYAGAAGATEAEMAKVLHFAVAADRLHPAFATLNKSLNPTGKAYQLSVANRLWGQKDYGFLPDFLAMTRAHYGAELAEVDFVNAAESARQDINKWVEEQTNSKIKDLMPQGVLNDLTRLVLTNAIYFKGTWKHQFPKDATHNAAFHVDADQQIQVPLMYQKEQFKYAEVAGFQLLELPYQGDDLSMLVLLPPQNDGIDALQDRLSAENIGEWTSRLRKQKIHAYLPRFKMTSEFQLNTALSSLGMPSAFSRQTADFSGISSQETLFISAVIHKAFVDVNEEGTEAAAATGIAVGTTSIEVIPTFRADRPFVFLIRDNRTGGILFLGRMLNPKT